MIFLKNEIKDLHLHSTQNEMFHQPFFCYFSFIATQSLFFFGFLHARLECTLKLYWYYWLDEYTLKIRMVQNQNEYISTKIVYDDVPISSDK